MKGKYSFKLLAVDVPSAVGKQQRIFLEGDEAAYSRGGIMSELRDPFIRVRPPGCVLQVLRCRKVYRAVHQQLLAAAPAEAVALLLPVVCVCTARWATKGHQIAWSADNPCSPEPAATVQVQRAEQDFEVEDELDEAADEAEEAQQRRISDAEKALNRPKPLDDGGGTFCPTASGNVPTAAQPYALLGCRHVLL